MHLFKARRWLQFQRREKPKVDASLFHDFLHSINAPIEIIDECTAKGWITFVKEKRRRVGGTFVGIGMPLKDTASETIPAHYLISEAIFEALASEQIGHQPATEKQRKPRTSKTANERMRETMERDPASKGWTARQWATHLVCSHSTVAETEAWKQLAQLRAIAKAERQLSAANQNQGLFDS